MSSVVLYVATSLDMYIADSDGGVDWLFHDQDYGYRKFFEGVDVVVMGRATYEQILEFGEWPYGSRPAFVFTNRKLKTDLPFVKVVEGSVEKALPQILNSAKKTVWLVGGSDLAAQFLAHDLIDELVISVHPVVLGSGIPLFQGTSPPLELELTGVESYSSGLAQLRYRRRHTGDANGCERPLHPSA